MNIYHFAVFIFLAVALICDLRERKIPNGLNLAGAFSGLLFHLATEGWSGLGYAFIGLVTGFTVVWLLYLTGAVGAGDVKLFAALGAWLGSAGAAYSAVYSIMYASVIGLIILACNGTLFGFIRDIAFFVWNKLVWGLPVSGLFQRDVHRIPFMIAVVPGVLSVVFFTELN